VTAVHDAFDGRRQSRPNVYEGRSLSQGCGGWNREREWTTTAEAAARSGAKVPSVAAAAITRRPTVDRAQAAVAVVGATARSGHVLLAILTKRTAVGPEQWGEGG